MHNVVELVNEGSVINGDYPVQFKDRPEDIKHCKYSKKVEKKKKSRKRPFFVVEQFYFCQFFACFLVDKVPVLRPFFLLSYFSYLTPHRTPPSLKLYKTFCTVMRGGPPRLLHLQHLDGICIGQNQYRLPLDPLMSIQNPGAEKLQTGNLEHLPIQVLEKNRVPDMGGK